MKHKIEQKDIKTRSMPPKVEQTKKGVVVQCPFCIPTHPILPGVASQCGTILDVKAIQSYLSSHATHHNKIHCLKCGEIGGEMVPYRRGYVHIKDCKPDTKLITEIPKLSHWAKAVFHMPAKVRSKLEKIYGVAKELKEIDTEGKQTGVTLGYFFWKG